MTDLERLAAVLTQKYPNSARAFSNPENIQSLIDISRECLELTVDHLLGLVEGTQVVVPVDPSDERIDITRPILLAFNMEFSRGFRFRHHFEALGIDLPEWAEPFADTITITKAMCAEMIYRAMTAQQGKSDEQ